MRKALALVAAPLLVSLPACKPAGGPADSEAKAVIGRVSDFEDVESYLAARRAGEARAAAPADRGADGYTIEDAINAVAVIRESCTAWLITRRHVVTNHHCVVADFTVDTSAEPYRDFDPNECRTMRINFAHQHNQSVSGYRRPPSENYRCSRILVSNLAHDLAIIELDREVTEDLKPLRIASRFDPAEGRALVVIGHPGANHKKISYRNTEEGRAATPCRSRPNRYMPNPETGEPYTGMDDPHDYEAKKNDNSFVHDCDTIGGNSGSPVLDAETLEVVGLHWNGWTLCKWAHYDPSGKLDDRNQTAGHGRGTARGNEANRKADLVRYREGNHAIDIRKVAAFVQGAPAGDGVGQLPEAVKAVFP